MTKTLSTRIWRCADTDYNNQEILFADKTHSDDSLAQIKEAGFNGIWLRAKLRELVPTDLFRRYIRNADKRMNSLQHLCDRAAKHQLGVWLYFTEPLGLDQSHKFWKDHPNLAGPVTSILDFAPAVSLCSSTPGVQNYLYEGFHELFKTVPLTGVILITASEHVNNCWSHVLSNPDGYKSAEVFWHSKCSCPRCAPRGADAVIAEVISTINTAVKSARSRAQVVAWDWSWNMHVDPPYRKIVDKLPIVVALMGDFERGGFVRRLGQKIEVEEYSLAYAGPSKRYASEVKAYGGKRSQFAKLQINTTHELATVINMPLMVSLYRKFNYLRKSQVHGIMATWNFACSPDTINVYAINKLCKQKKVGDEKSWLKTLAKEYFGKGTDSGAVVAAWYAFQRAMNYYPSNGNKFVYWSPINYALGYPLKTKFSGKPVGPSWIEHEFSDNDNLDQSLGGFSLEDVVSLLGKLSSKWYKACWLYEKALTEANDKKRKNQELASAMVTAGSFRSCYNIYRWYALRKNKRSAVFGADEQQIIDSEIQNLKLALPFVESDQRMGYHAEAKWQMFNGSAIKRKIIDLEKIHSC